MGCPRKRRSHVKGIRLLVLYCLFVVPLLICSSCLPARMIHPSQPCTYSTAGTDITRRLTINEDSLYRGLLGSHVSLMQCLTGERPSEGNYVKLLANGPTAFQAMLRAIRGAKDHVNVEFYIVRDDETGRQFADLFLEKRAEGVQVNIIHDVFGSLGTSAGFFDRLREGGVNIAGFHYGNIAHRNHRKLLIVDGTIAFTGGMNIGTEYARSPSRHGVSRGWRDTLVRIEGPAVAQFQKLFLESWRFLRNSTPQGGNYFPELRPIGHETVMAVGSTPQNKNAYQMYLSAFDNANCSIHVTNSYFAPDRRIIESLIRAAKRDVDVRLILPSKTDHSFIRMAGRSRYGRLLSSGVKLYELRSAPLHAKTAVIDGVWSTVGSTNINPWSFRRSDEIDALILGEEFGAEMERQFAEDLKDSKEMTLDQWAERSYLGRLTEGLANLLAW